ncbi:MAG: prolipoprotein diacylglyceryl transferase, partial [Candidatus Peregrinibacteria bacterium]
MIFVNDFSPVIFEIGPVGVRWYGVLFALGLVGFYLIVRWAFKRERLKVEDLDSLALWIFFGIVVGARLGHVVFYRPWLIWQDPVEILRIWNGGLASHGALIGVVVAYFVWCRLRRVKFGKYVNPIILGAPFAAMMVRIGNFVNSEIVGVQTDGSWGVVFKGLGEGFPRHPAQLYEAGLLAVILAVFLVIYLKWRKMPDMFLGFLFLGLYFGGRFVIEFWKDLHVLPAGFPLSMGQVLSV